MLTRVPDEGFVEYERLLARRVVVVASWVALVLLPALQVLEYSLGYADHDTWRVHALLRVGLVAAAIVILWLRARRPDGVWPRPAALSLSLLLMASGWWMLLVHFASANGDAHYISHGLAIGTVAVAVLATSGAVDLVLVYGPPLVLVAVALWWMGLEPAWGTTHFAYPIVSMVVGVVIAEMLFRGHHEAFVATRELQRSARTDSLTRLLNRRAMCELLRAEHSRSARHGTPYAVIMADLDRFKEVNDAHGHDVGDQVLREVALRLEGALRAEDSVARWGGEEFLVLLPGADGAAAVEAAERMRPRVGQSPFSTSGGSLSITVSLGVAARRDDASFEDVIERADQALYAAKQGGRNRTESG